jgi:hypothetical protein
LVNFSRSIKSGKRFFNGFRNYESVKMPPLSTHTGVRKKIEAIGKRA